MLNPTDLRAALTDAVKAAGVCNRWCRSKAEVEDSGYLLVHSAISMTQTRVDPVYAKHVLDMDAARLTALLERWVRAAHAGKPLDLNEEGA